MRHVEHELLITGIGGQGVQLATQVVARAAIAEGREVQLFGSYGGMMRGGNTDTTLVIGDRPIEAPPTTDRAWSAILMHPEFAAATLAHVRTGGLVFVNSSLVPSAAVATCDRQFHSVSVAATDLAVDAGNILAATMVMIGAFAHATGLVAVASLANAVAASLPSYRTQHILLNQRAIEVGCRHAPAVPERAWNMAPSSISGPAQ